jgi:hypothetical protein
MAGAPAMRTLRTEMAASLRRRNPYSSGAIII